MASPSGYARGVLGNQRPSAIVGSNGHSYRDRGGRLGDDLPLLGRWVHREMCEFLKFENWDPTPFGAVGCAVFTRQPPACTANHPHPNPYVS